MIWGNLHIIIEAVILENLKKRKERKKNPSDQMDEENGIWKTKAVKSNNSWIHHLCHFLASKGKKTLDVSWSSHSLLVENRHIHKLETSCILVSVLRKKKIPSWFSHKEFWAKLMDNIFNRCIAPSPRNKKCSCIPHMTISYIEAMWIWENALHLVLYR